MKIFWTGLLVAIGGLFLGLTFSVTDAKPAEAGYYQCSSSSSWVPKGSRYPSSCNSSTGNLGYSTASRNGTVTTWSSRYVPTTTYTTCSFTRTGPSLTTSHWSGTIYVGESAYWSYGVNGTGVWSGNSAGWTTNVSTSSGGTKSLSTTKSFSWARDVGSRGDRQVCNSSASFSASTTVLVKQNVTVTCPFSTSGPSMQVLEQGVDTRYIYQNESGRWAYGVTGTGLFSGYSAGTWYTTINTSSPGTKRLETTRNWTWVYDTREKRTTCNGSRGFVAEVEVHKAEDVSLTFSHSSNKGLNTFDSNMTTTFNTYSYPRIGHPKGTVFATFTEGGANYTSRINGSGKAVINMITASEYFRVIPRIYGVERTWWHGNDLNSNQTRGYNNVTYAWFKSDFPKRWKDYTINPPTNYWMYSKLAPIAAANYKDSGIQNRSRGLSGTEGIQYAGWVTGGFLNTGSGDAKFEDIQFLEQYDGLGPDSKTVLPSTRKVWYMGARVADAEHNQYATRPIWAMKCEPESTGVAVSYYDRGQSRFETTGTYQAMTANNQYLYQLDGSQYSNPATTLLTSFSSGAKPTGNDSWYTLSLPQSTISMGTDTLHYFPGATDVSNQWDCLYNNPKITPVITFDIPLNTPQANPTERLFSTAMNISVKNIKVKSPQDPNRVIRTEPFLVIEATKVGTNEKVSSQTSCHNTGNTSNQCASAVLGKLSAGDWDVRVRWSPNTRFDNSSIFNNATSAPIRITVFQVFECQLSSTPIGIRYINPFTGTTITTTTTDATLIRSGIQWQIIYPEFNLNNVLGIIPTNKGGVDPNVRSQMTLKNDSTPYKVEEVSIYRNGTLLPRQSTSETNQGYWRFNTTWEPAQKITGTRWRLVPSGTTDSVSIVWPSTIGANGARTPMQFIRQAEVYATAFELTTRPGDPPVTKWHTCLDNYQTAKLTITSSQVTN
jgi:hypothetical protein